MLPSLCILCYVCSHLMRYVELKVAYFKAVLWVMKQNQSALFAKMSLTNFVSACFQLILVLFRKKVIGCSLRPRC